jgi:hypothetical protein
MSDTKLVCKVKIGSAYTPKWFERRQTNGWYSGKNPPLDRDAMGLQSALLNSYGFSRPRTGVVSICSTAVGCVLFAWIVWAMFF